MCMYKVLIAIQTVQEGIIRSTLPMWGRLIRNWAKIYWEKFNSWRKLFRLCNESAQFSNKLFWLFWLILIATRQRKILPFTKFDALAPVVATRTRHLSFGTENISEGPNVICISHFLASSFQWFKCFKLVE